MENFQVCKLGLVGAEEPEIKLPTFARSWRKQRGFQEKKKKINCCFTDTLKPLTLWIITNCRKLLKRWEYQTYLPGLLRNWYVGQVSTTRHLTGSKLGNEYDKAIYCYPAYLTSTWSASYEIPGWKMDKLESRLSGETATTLEMQMTPLQW